MGNITKFKKNKSKKSVIPEKTEAEIMSENRNALLNTIISETFARHNELSEDEYKKVLGNESVSEDKLVKVGMYNIMIEITKHMFELQHRNKLSTEIIKNILLKKEEGK